MENRISSERIESTLVPAVYHLILTTMHLMEYWSGQETLTWHQ